MESEKVVGRHCSYLSIMGWLSACRLLVEEDPWGQHLWKGGGRSRNGQRKMSMMQVQQEPQLTPQGALELQ